MISSVTASTVMTITTAAASAASVLSFVAILLLLGLLISKELVGEERRSSYLNRALNVAILPLLLSFVLIAGTRLLEVLR